MENESQPPVSVVIPTYNRDWALARALDSVCRQTYPNREIIVVDDGSCDQTPDLLSSYTGRVRVVRTGNRGVSAARNTGIKQAAGRFVALLDSDDSWTADKLDVQIRFFRQHPDALICQTEETWIRNGRHVNPRNRHKKPSGLIFEPSLHLCLVSPSAVMMKRSLFDMVGLFDETFPVCEDYDLWLRVSAAGIPIHRIDRPCTVKYGGHGDQLSTQHSQDKYRIRSIVQLLSSGCLNRAQDLAARRVLGEKCRIYGQGCLKRGREGEGQFYLNLAGRSDFTSPIAFP